MADYSIDNLCDDFTKLTGLDGYAHIIPYIKKLQEEVEFQTKKHTHYSACAHERALCCEELKEQVEFQTKKHVYYYCKYEELGAMIEDAKDKQVIINKLKEEKDVLECLKTQNQVEITQLKETCDELSLPYESLCFENDEINRKWAEDNTRHTDIIGELNEEVKELREQIKGLNVLVEEAQEDSDEEETKYEKDDDWVWGYGNKKKEDNEYVINISGGGDGVSPNGFEDWVIKRMANDELGYYIRHGGEIADALQVGKKLVSCPDGNYVSFQDKDYELCDGEMDFDWLDDALK